MSALRIRQDRVFGVLNGTISNSASSFSITPDANSTAMPAFGSPQIMAFILEPGTNNEEIVWVTSSTSNQTSGLSIQRGQEGTTPIAHSSGVVYKHGPTLYDWQPNPIQDTAWLRSTTTNALDDEFNNGVLAAAWSRVDTASTNNPSYLVAADVLSISHLANGGGSADNAGPAHCVLKSLAGKSYPTTIEIGYRLLRKYATNYQMFGPIFTDGILSSSRGVWMMPYGDTSLATAQQTSIRSFSALSGSQVDATDGPAVEALGGFLHARIQWTAANTFTISHSPDGVQWWPVVSNFTTTLSGGLVPAYAGFAISNWTTNQPCMASVEYFRVT